ncbi:hypothetical protein [Goodfellowiella coeruleoviolacea]|uniref:hypothetical protein n=1 Tax=Goodfellowiella coeruleoviolacea TaxID=334858 RepID=UPI0020A29026|nr:hypothetical protein [Goodfellowiella coeruleoviolacea]
MSQGVTVDRILRESFPHIEAGDPVSYFTEVGDAVQALMYSWLFWPKLLEIHGAVFLALHGNDESDIRERLYTPLGDMHPEWPPLSWNEAVDSFNVFEIPHLFRQVRGPIELFSASHWELGKVLVQIWGARLSVGFPNRRFSVCLIDADDSMDLRIQVSQASPDLVIPAGWDNRRRSIITNK